ncbi:hypothetical protein C8R47DRAFT_1161489 [Mycena vitilis]|nr:hypothetical protein C8R47DRAFT_1161489 [Mycena vitilis]
MRHHRAVRSSDRTPSTVHPRRAPRSNVILPQSTSGAEGSQSVPELSKAANHCPNRCIHISHPLKHLRLNFCATDECLILLKRASNPTNCSIFYPLPSTGPLPIVPPMPSPFLNLTFSDEARSGPMLVALTLPALTHLVVFVRAANVDGFLSFLDRSAPKLQFLCIYANLSETLLLKCLNHPALRSIQILYLIFTDDTVFPTPFILQRIHDPDFLPSLQRLFISEPSGGLPPSQLDTLCH